VGTGKQKEREKKGLQNQIDGTGKEEKGSMPVIRIFFHFKNRCSQKRLKTRGAASSEVKRKFFF